MIDADVTLPSELFSGIDPEVQGQIARLGERQRLNAGGVLFREADPARRCYYVRRGRLKLTQLHETGRETTVRYIGPHEVTAAVAVFKGALYPVTATVVEASEVIGWQRQTLLSLMEAHPTLAVGLLRVVIDRLEDIQRRYMELCAEQVDRRLARTLLRIMRHSGKKTDAGILIDFRLSRQDLADYAGTTLYTVSRTLSAWEKLGWIASRRERVVIADPHALVAFAAAD